MRFTLSEIEFSLLTLASAGYLLAWLGYLWAFWRRREALTRRASMIVRVAFGAQLLFLFVRSYRSEHLPIYNLYEFCTVFAAGVVIAHLVWERAVAHRLLGVTTLPVALALLFYAWTLSSAVEPVFPIFRSVWLQVHILTALVAYSALTATFGASCLFLTMHNAGVGGPNTAHSARLAQLDRVAYRAATVGFCFLTACVISGAVWAEYVWGNFWSWDPKETWSLITWFIFAAYLHTRYHRGWREKRAAVLGIVGFALVIMTFLGVDLLDPGTHDFLFWRKV